MTFQETFSEIKKTLMKADISDHKGHLAIQVNLTGEGEGIFYVEMDDDKLNVEPYDYNDRDVQFIVDSKNFIKIINGKMDPVLAFTTGKLKVEGDLGKALEIKKLIKNI